MPNRKNLRTAAYALPAWLLVSLVLAHPPAAAAAAATGGGGTLSAVATARVTVLAPTAIGESHALSFSAVIRPGAGRADLVSIDAGDNVTVGGSRAPHILHPAATSGVLAIAGPPYTAYTLTQTLRPGGAGAGWLAAASVQATSGVAGLLPASGTQEVRYGGALRIDPTMPPGGYQDYLQVTASYN